MWSVRGRNMLLISRKYIAEVGPCRKGYLITEILPRSKTVFSNTTEARIHSTQVDTGLLEQRAYRKPLTPT